MTTLNDSEPFPPPIISDQDIYEAMKEIPGYLDISLGDFKELYKLVYHHAFQRIAESLRAEDIMTWEVVTVREETTVQKAAELMAVQKVSGVPVVDSKNHVVGMLSERDFLSRMGGGKITFMDVVARCLEGKGCAALAIRGKKVAEIMTSPAITVKENDIFIKIKSLLKKEKINRVPVTDQHDCLVGIISREDIVHTPLVGEIS